MGPGKEYCRGLLLETIRAMQGVDAVFIALDGVDLVGSLCANEIAERLHPLAGVSIFGRIARMREASRRFFLSTDRASIRMIGGDWTHLYWHDADMIPPVDIIPKLLARDAPVSAGLYAMRDSDPDAPVLPMMTRLWDPNDPQRLESQVDVLDMVDDCLFPVGYGQGCMLVDRATMESTPYRDPASYTGDVYGEDIQWCIDAGVPILVDTTIRVWHVGEDGNGVRPELGVRP